MHFNNTTELSSVHCVQFEKCKYTICIWYKANYREDMLKKYIECGSLYEYCIMVVRKFPILYLPMRFFIQKFSFIKITSFKHTYL